jgi:hypothetical protein
VNFLVQIVDGCKFIVEALASAISFDNSTSTLTSTNVQDAIVELANSAPGSSDSNLDGGFANSVYTPEQCFDGGGA